ncbi:hypothetical protein K449DRAFT_391194 [Hypoxylon sp. EC38]|nr:hypothetical protein K449DRAFT_391194 [Hypoxylon sp. EC38]
MMTAVEEALAPRCSRFKYAQYEIPIMNAYIIGRGHFGGPMMRLSSNSQLEGHPEVQCKGTIAEFDI